jgi:lactoylglutathione lyase
MLQFAYSIIYVSDVAKTVAFYESAFGLTNKFITPEKDYAEMLSGETTISFALQSFIEPQLGLETTIASIESRPLGFELGFTTENVNEAFQKAIANGAVAVMAPTEKPWGQTVSYVRDCNGVLIEICTKVG